MVSGNAAASEQFSDRDGRDSLSNMFFRFPSDCTIGLQDWCAKPQRCYDLRGGKKISGQNGCPVLAVNNPASPPPSIVTTSTRSFTDLNGRPTFALELLTIEDPSFTANTEFAGSRPTDAGGSGGSNARQVLSLFSGFASFVAVLWILV